MRGQAIFAYDRGAQLAAAALQKSTGQPFGGTIVGRVANGLWVFDAGQLAADRSAFSVAYRIAQRSKGSAAYVVSPGPVAVPDVQQDLAEARALALARATLGPTTRPYADAILLTDSGAMLLYLYPAQTDAKVHPFGADVRYAISADGTTVLEKLQLHDGPVVDHTVASDATQSLSTMAKNSGPGAGLQTAPNDTDVFDVMVCNSMRFFQSDGNVYVLNGDGSIEQMQRAGS